MRYRITSFIILIFMATGAGLPLKDRERENNGSEWYPFVLAEHLDSNSPANIGKLVLDPPAGKHGFCKVKDGHRLHHMDYYFEPRGIFEDTCPECKDPQMKKTGKLNPRQLL